MISANIVVKIFLVNAFLSNTCRSFVIQSTPKLSVSSFIRQEEGIIGTSNKNAQQRPEQSTPLVHRHSMSYLQMQSTGDDNNESNLPNAHNSTGADTPIFFADEECYDLCELVEEEEELEDVGLSSSSPTLLDVEIQSETSTVPIENPRIATATNQVASASSSNNSEKSAEKVMGNIELRWNIDEDKDDCDLEDVSTCSDACDVCVGKGVIDCQFCKGVGWIDFGQQNPGTMGERLVERNGGIQGTECPVCNEDSNQVCQKCMGSGWIARWRMRNLSNDLQP